MRHVHNVSGLTPQRKWNRDVISPEGLVVLYVELLEVFRQRSELVKIPMRSDQQILITIVERTEVAHKIPDVCADAELIDFSNIDRNSHGGIQQQGV